MKNQVIKAVKKEDGPKIINYFKSLGIDTKSYIGNNYEEDGDKRIYYGVINGSFDNYGLGDVRQNNAEIIKLPETYERGERVLVSDNGQYWAERIYLTTIEGTENPFICVAYDYEEKYNDGEFLRYEGWKRIKKLDKKVEYTIEELAKLAGVSVE